MKTNSPLQPYRSIKPSPKPEKSLSEENQSFGQKMLGFLWGLTRWTFRLGVMACLLIVAGAGGSYMGLKYSLEKQLPDISKLELYAPIETTEILDAQGQTLYSLYGEENRRVVPLQEVPDLVQKAVITAEDARFYEHFGVDPMGLARAVKINFDSGLALQGGSTITQQVIKNMFLTPERTIERKLAEMWMAVKVEERYSKAQILELYLNQIYWGHNAYGIEAAAQNYFGKPVKQLELAEGALLAGILTGPEIYSPYRAPDKAKYRQKLTLDRMVEIGFISQQEADKAYARKLVYPGVKKGVMRYPYFTSYVLSVLKHNYGDSEVFKRGMRVHTTLNKDWQTGGEKLLREHIARNARSRVSQGALIAIENETGFVRAIIGGTGFEKSQFNRAWQAQRQPGSAFKPFVYLAAFARGYEPDHIEVDEPIQYRYGSYVWKPRNYSGGHSGPQTLQRALEHSNNIIAVKLAERVGNGNVIEMAHKLGVRSPLRNVLSLALGPSEITPLEMASAYSTIARGGTYLEPTPILWIEDRFGNIIEDNRRRYAERVVSLEATGKVIHLMKGVIARGTAPQARIGRPAGGKTGTTSDHKDAWFVGFTPQITAATWIGNDQPISMYGYATGGHLSAPLWASFMRMIHKDLKIEDFPQARGMLPILAGKKIDDSEDGGTGFLAQYERLNAKEEPTEPKENTLINPGDLSIPIEETLPMELPATAATQSPASLPMIQEQRANPPQSLKRDKKIVTELDQLIRELDRLDIPEQKN